MLEWIKFWSWDMLLGVLNSRDPKLLTSVDTLYWPTLQVLASPEMTSQNKNGVRSPKSERGYCRSLQHHYIGTRIASIPHTSSKICPVKDRSPMAFSDP